MAGRIEMTDAPHGKLRDECSNANQFLSIDDARSKIEARDQSHMSPIPAVAMAVDQQWTSEAQRPK